MSKLSSSTEYMYIPVTGPTGTDLTQFTVSAALIPESTGGEPADSDYKPATWVNGEVALLITKGEYPDGQYLSFVRVLVSPQDLRLLAGRYRIGDARV